MSEIEVLVVLVPLTAVKETLLYASLLASGGLLSIFGIPWIANAPPDLCFYLHGVCVSVGVQIFPFYEHIVILD